MFFVRENFGMKRHNCQRVRTLRRAEEKNADLVACDACGARFKILRNNAAPPNAPNESKRKKQRDARTSPTGETKFIPVPPPVLDPESFADETRRPTSPLNEVEESTKRVEYEEYEERQAFVPKRFARRRISEPFLAKRFRRVIFKASVFIF